jgi:hypothetical protein
LQSRTHPIGSSNIKPSIDHRPIPNCDTAGLEARIVLNSKGYGMAMAGVFSQGRIERMGCLFGLCCHKSYRTTGCRVCIHFFVCVLSANSHTCSFRPSPESWLGFSLDRARSKLRLEKGICGAPLPTPTDHAPRYAPPRHATPRQITIPYIPYPVSCIRITRITSARGQLASER